MQELKSPFLLPQDWGSWRANARLKGLTEEEFNPFRPFLLSQKAHLPRLQSGKEDQRLINDVNRALR